MSALGPRANGLFLIRVCLVLLAVGVIGNSCANLVLYLDGRARVEQINRERADNTERNCRDVNRRHDRALAALDTILEARLKTASREQRERLREGRDTTVLLIESLTPRRDCVAYARQQVSGKP